MSKKLTVRDFATALGVLKSIASVDHDAPWHHKGIRVVLNGLTVTFNAVSDGQAIELQLAAPLGHPGSGSFFLSYSDLDTLNPLLLSDQEVGVEFSRTMQPQTRKPALLIQSSDLWFQCYTGLHRGEGYPARSIWTRGCRAKLSEIETLRTKIRPLAQDNSVKVGPINEYQTTIQITNPLPPIASVKCVLY